ncbi:uncharacterized protein LOC144763959 isoform X2 [Lissotriton helveticus]
MPTERHGSFGKDFFIVTKLYDAHPWRKAEASGKTFTSRAIIFNHGETLYHLLKGKHELDSRMGKKPSSNTRRNLYKVMARDGLSQVKADGRLLSSLCSNQSTYQAEKMPSYRPACPRLRPSLRMPNPEAGADYLENANPYYTLLKQGRNSAKTQ